MTTRGGFEVDSPQGERWQLALDLLGRGDEATVVYRGLGLWLDRRSTGEAHPGLLTVAVQSSWQDQNVTEETALEDIARAASTVGELMDASPEFKALLGARPIEYLLLDDYGMGAVHICVSRAGELEWMEPFGPDGS